MMTRADTRASWCQPSEHQRFRGPDGEDFPDVARDEPFGFESEREMGHVTRLQRHRGAPLLRDRDLSFQDVDKLIPAERPLESAGSTFPEAARYLAIVRLDQYLSSCAGGAFENPRC